MDLFVNACIPLWDTATVYADVVVFLLLTISLKGPRLEFPKHNLIPTHNLLMSVIRAS